MVCIKHFSAGVSDSPLHLRRVTGVESTANTIIWNNSKNDFNIITLLIIIRSQANTEGHSYLCTTGPQLI